MATRIAQVNRSACGAAHLVRQLTSYRHGRRGAARAAAKRQVGS
jgi:hypothetical protein